MFRRIRPGFTIIELLVVVSLIAILVGILFPVFAEAREKGRTTSCLSNVRQIGMAYTMYLQDWDETQISYRSKTPTFDSTWMHLLYPYAHSSDLFNCPGSRQRWPGPDESGGMCGYGYNGLMLGWRSF